MIETAQIEPESAVLDLGCGYGADWNCGSKTVPDVAVTMVDVNERAVQLAKANAAMNQADDHVEILVSDGFSQLQGRKFDRILFNPPIRAGKSDDLPSVSRSVCASSSRGIIVDRHSQTTRSGISQKRVGTIICRCG